MPDPDALQRARQGEVEAYGEVVRLFHGQVRGFVALLGVAISCQDEVVQDVFIDAWRALPRYDGARPFAPWLNGVARNVVRRHQADQARERLRAGATARWLRERSGPAAPDPHADRLRACLEQLPDHAQNLVHLRYSEALDSASIAARLGRTAEAVRMALMRIRRTLGDCIKAEP